MSTGVGMSECCLSGKIQKGEPTGTEKQIGGLDTYVSEPKDAKDFKVVVFLVDIFGWKFPNVRLLADSYAKAGYTAYIPDVHQGDSLPIDFLQTVEPPLPERESQTLTQKAAATAKTGATLGPWLAKHREGVSKPLIEDFLSAVRSGAGSPKIGTIGFCWGGRYAILSAQGDLVDAAYACHPSLVSVPGDFEKVVKPLSLALGSEDSLLGEKEQKQIQEIMQGKADVQSEVRVYEKQVHGFALRGDWSSEKDKEAMDQAEKQGLEWFGRFL
ncbi:hypothetical protein NX059_007226 [Plenodomus lindquistii]|nr:hypothetical protein NX059_007226 [Plenodomus lindquistii]